MVKRKIAWTATATKQRRTILSYWKKRNNSSKYSEKLVAIIAEHLKVIALYPESFKSTEFPEIRESAMGHFSIYYSFSDSEITVLAFWDNRQDPIRLYAEIL